jgi:hypothetical protein
MSNSCSYAVYRLRQWMAAENVLPDSQNGFREGYQTNNCSFILRCAIDRSRALKLPLYVAFLDLVNAFPSTNLPTLWVKLFLRGARGPLLDWLRMVYTRMEYAVKQACQQGVECTMRFRSLWGILAGDTASPGLFTYYLSDFRPPPDVDDLILSGHRISNIEEADDVALFLLRGVRALQGKLDYMHLDWCATNFLSIGPPKSKGMIFGPIPSVLPTLVVGGERLEFVDEFKSVGVTFKSTHRFVFARHYVNKASKACNIVFATFAMESMVGTIPPRQGLQLYKSRTDPHLTFACEVAIDVDDSFLALLEDVQILFLRRLLGLHKRSMRAVLFTETGITPIRYPRIILVLRYLEYLLKLPARRYARAAFDDACLLHAEKKPSWGEMLPLCSPALKSLLC